MILPRALTEHLKGSEEFRKASCLKPKEGFRENTEIARRWEEEKDTVSSPTMNPSSSKFTSGGKVESVQSFLIKSPFNVGLPLRKVKLHCQCPFVASQNSRRADH